MKLLCVSFQPGIYTDLILWLFG